MRHRLFAFAYKASLLLCLAMVVFWIDSTWHRDGMGSSIGTSRIFFIVVERGTFWVGFEKTNGPWLIGIRSDLNGMRMESTFLGFGFLDGFDKGIGIPLWLLLPVLCTISFFLRRAGRRIVEPGFCKCGYDLTGNTSGGCPECGSPIPQKTGATA